MDIPRWSRLADAGSLLALLETGPGVRRRSRAAGRADAAILSADRRSLALSALAAPTLLLAHLSALLWIMAAHAALAPGALPSLAAGIIAALSFLALSLSPLLARAAGLDRLAPAQALAARAAPRGGSRAPSGRGHSGGRRSLM